LDEILKTIVSFETLKLSRVTPNQKIRALNVWVRDEISGLLIVTSLKSTKVEKEINATF